VAPASGARLAVLPAVDPTRTGPWKMLEKDRQNMKSFHLRQYRDDTQRVKEMSQEFRSGDARIYFDFSKNLVTDVVMKHLFQLARVTKLPKAIRQMFAGEKINETEDRAVLHTALRAPEDAQIFVDGQNVIPAIHRELAHMKQFSDDINSGAWKGYHKDEITDIVNIGIGGSDLGGVMATEVLEPFATGKVRVHFVSNVDATDFIRKVVKGGRDRKGLDPRTTLFIISSKTFTTEETMTNANSAKNWFLKLVAEDYRQNGDFDNFEKLAEEAIKKHFVAVSTAKEKVKAFGIDSKNMFEFWDWVGGRYSVWSAIGLSLATYIGFDNFKEFLAGAHDMDEHFRTAPLEQNIPVRKALLAIWYRNFYGAETHAVLPYSQYMHRAPAYLQQLVMESNGKSISRLGKIIHYMASSIWWGEAGTNGQHSFYQLLHQIARLSGKKSKGTIVPADFIGVAISENPLGDHNEKLLANFAAQTKALAYGKTKEEVARSEKNAMRIPHRVFQGNNPTNSVLINRLTPRAFGAWVASYEHQTFVEGIIMNIFSFDQWGVEEGKAQAGPIRDELLGKPTDVVQDESTKATLRRIQSYQGARLAEERQRTGTSGQATGARSQKPEARSYADLEASLRTPLRTRLRTLGATEGARFAVLSPARFAGETPVETTVSGFLVNSLRAQDLIQSSADKDLLISILFSPEDLKLLSISFNHEKTKLIVSLRGSLSEPLEIDFSESYTDKDYLTSVRVKASDVVRSMKGVKQSIEMKLEESLTVNTDQGVMVNMPMVLTGDYVKNPALVDSFLLQAYQASGAEYGKNVLFRFHGADASVNEFIAQRMKELETQFPNLKQGKLAELFPNKETPEGYRDLFFVAPGRVEPVKGSVYLSVQKPQKGDIVLFPIQIGVVAARTENSEDPTIDDRLRMAIETALGQRVNDLAEFSKMMYGRADAGQMEILTEKYQFPSIVRLTIDEFIQGARLALQSIGNAA
jgi:glucose-6-phosphate isomerase